MRCPDCNKFVGMENGDPEIESIDVDEQGGIQAEVRATRVCADCGTELKEGRFSMEATISDELRKAFDALTVEEKESVEWDSEDGETSANEGGGGRYAKNIITVEVSVVVILRVGEDGTEKGRCEVSLTDSMAAGEFDECC